MDTFVSEPLKPLPGGADTAAIGRGEPGLPTRFEFRGSVHTVVQRLGSWKSSTREGGVGELYLRRHWHEILTDTHLRMTVYCERQARSAKAAKRRWFVYSIANPDRLTSLIPHGPPPSGRTE